MSAPTPPALDFNNVQGDILLGGLPKKTQTFLFFQIDQNRVQDFRTQLYQLVPLITTTAQTVKDRAKIAQNKGKPLLKLSGVNVAFTHKALLLMGIKDDIGDTVFDGGMLADAQNLGDPPKSTSGPFAPNWDPAFTQDIHGVITVTGDCHATVDGKFAQVNNLFSFGKPNATIHLVKKTVGDVRPGKESGHEHFGFLDGVSQPAVKDVDTTPNPGQETVRQGIILLGRENDPTTRPSWALDGTFLAFRYLSQLVPEFNNFLKANAIPGLPPAQGAELLGARLVGRWKSGAPIDLTPIADDPALGADPKRNDNFRFDLTNPDDQTTQDRCPFAAHVRKTNPRADLEDHNNISTETRRIIRSGIAFGPEVSANEAANGKTSQDRGLLFVAYQSDIKNGFQFIQHSWANTPTFPPFKPAGVVPGFDPIIGQVGTQDPNTFQTFGTNPKSQATGLKLSPPTSFVVPRGGEYFFTPSIPALKETFALKPSGAHTGL